MLAEGWIGSRRYDLIFFFGAALFSVALATSFLIEPALVVPAWWLWLWLGDGPHLWATYTRTYFDPEQRRLHSRFFWLSFLLFIPGIIAWAFTLVGVRELFDLYLFAALVWSTHHAARQNYGILSIYHRHASNTSHPSSLPDDNGRASRHNDRVLDTKFLYAFFWGLSAIFWLSHPMGRVALMMPPRLPAWAEGSLLTAKLGLLGAGLWYLWQTLQRVREQRAHWPALFLVCQVGALAFAYFVLGIAEPLYPNAQDPEQFFLAVTVAGGLLHSSQYLAIVFAVNKRHHKTGESWLARLSRAPGKMYFLFVVGSLLYLLLLASRGNSPALNFFALNSPAAKLFLALYWGVFFHHYYLDQIIWRPHQDPQLREDLGLTSPARV
jgi:hypothetical protein